jgi:inhibitor of cysteine peptidase
MLRKLLLALLLPLGLVGCLPPSLFPVEMPVTASLPDSGGEVSLLPGQPLVIRLPSNPSTGYGWSYTVVGDDVLRLDSVSGVGALPNGKIGAPGDMVWSFRAQGKGIAELNFVYTRPWEKSVMPAKTFRLTTVVQAAP